MSNPFKVCSVVYGYAYEPHWRIMRDQLERQLGSRLTVLDLQIDQKDLPADDYTQLFEPKIRAWSSFLGEQAEDQLVLFTDLDMLPAGDWAAGWDYPEPVVAIRSRPGSINTGQLLVRNCPASRNILHQLHQLMLGHNRPTHWDQLVREQYAGDQAALAWLLEQQTPGLAEVGEGLFNLCNAYDEWRTSRWIHIKSGLRVLVFDLDSQRYSQDKLGRIDRELVEYCREAYRQGCPELWKELEETVVYDRTKLVEEPKPPPKLKKVKKTKEPPTTRRMRSGRRRR